MARGKADIKTRLKRQEEKILKCQSNWKKKHTNNFRKKITEAFLKSKRSVDEVLDFLKGKADL